MKELECSQDFSHYVYGDFSRRLRTANSAVLGPIWPNFELVRDVMDVLVICKYEDYPIKNEGARVVTTLYINILDAKGQITQESAVVHFSHYKSMEIFSDAQGQLTPQPLVRSGRISNSFEMLWMSLLSASMKTIQSKMKALEWSQHYTSIF